MSRRRRQNCPRTSSKKQKKRRKTENITMIEETKSGLVDSDKGSYMYYEQYFSTSSDSDGDGPVGSSRQKINSMEQ